MSDVMTGLRQVIRDLVAPELKSYAVKLEALQKTVDMNHESEAKTAELRHEAVMRTLDSFRSEFAALRATNELEVLRQVSPISERIAIVESRVKQG